MDGVFYTDRGKVRPHNEDSGGLYQNQSGQYLAVIADGMGGHQAGDVASNMATQKFEEKWQACEKITSPEQAEKWLVQMLDDINTLIYNMAQDKAECKGMGTTIVITLFSEDFFTVAHIGDSRCYKYQNGILTQITDDHSLVNELVRSGEISKKDAQHHPQKNVVLKALGTQPKVEADVRSLSWDKDAVVLLCSDGLTDKVDDDDLKYHLSQDADISMIGQRLIDLANDRGGEDNVSLVLMKHPIHSEKGESTC